MKVLLLGLLAAASMSFGASGTLAAGSVERGERNVSVLNLRAIARALRVPMADLLQDLA